MKILTLKPYSLHIILFVAIGIRLLMPLYIIVSKDYPIRFMILDSDAMVFNVACDFVNGDDNQVILENIFQNHLSRSKLFYILTESIPLWIYSRCAGTNLRVAVAIIQIMQGVLDSLGCILIYRILILFGQPQLKFHGSLLYAIWPPSVFYAYHLLDEAYIPIIVLSIGYALLLLLIRRKTGYYFLLAFLMCILMLLRIDNALILPLLFFYLLWMNYKEYWRNGKKILLFLCMTLIMYTISMRLIIHNVFDVSEKEIAAQRITYYEKYQEHYCKIKSETDWFALSLYNMLGEYPGTYKGLRSGNDWVTSEHIQKQIEHYNMIKDGKFMMLTRMTNLQPSVIVGIREVIWDKPILYADRFVRRLFVYFSSHNYIACMAYFFTEPKPKDPTKPSYWTMMDYRYSQIYNGFKYIDYTLFALFLGGMIVMRNHRFTPAFLMIYLGILVGHAATMVGEFYFMSDQEIALINPKYLIGMASLWPIFIPIAANSVFKIQKNAC